MSIDISGMNEAELRELNHRVVARLNAMRGARTRRQLDSFNIGDSVWFLHKGRRYEGTVTKLNAKTAGVQVGPQSWRVSPGLLKRAAA